MKTPIEIIIEYITYEFYDASELGCVSDDLHDAYEALTALKEIEEVDDDSLWKDLAKWCDREEMSLGKSAELGDIIQQHLHQRGMLRTKVEKIEGLEEAVEFYSGESSILHDLDTHENALYKAARKYLAMEKNDA